MLRDYLVRLAQSLERAQDAAIAVPASTQSPRRTETETTAARRETGELRSLVVKTAERIERQVREDVLGRNEDLTRRTLAASERVLSKAENESEFDFDSIRRG